MENLIRLAVIGTSGRKRPLERRHFAFMLQALEAEIVLHHWKVVLVSGGAAWADHAAVVMARQKKLPLELHLPCPYDFQTGAFADNHRGGWKTNPGPTANHYHRPFSREIYGDEVSTLREIGWAIYEGARALIGAGFFERNSEVAKADRILAFTYAPGDAPNDGGTLDTWKKAQRLGRACRHVSLLSCP